MFNITLITNKYKQNESGSPTKMVQPGLLGPLSPSTVVPPPFILPELIRVTRDRSPPLASLRFHGSRPHPACHTVKSSYLQTIQVHKAGLFV